MNDQNRITAIFQRIGGRFACVQCGRKFRARDATLLEEWDEQWLVRLDCAICHASMLLTVRIEDRRLRLFPLDLTPEEWPHFREMASITIDDVIETTRLMLDYEGDFTDILEDPLAPSEADIQ